MGRLLGLVLAAAVAGLAALLITQEPTALTVPAAVACVALAVAALASLVLLRTAAPGRGPRARASKLRAVRRGVEAGAAVGLIAALQLIGGLTPLTALFVVLSFLVAEFVLSAGASASS